MSNAAKGEAASGRHADLFRRTARAALILGGLAIIPPSIALTQMHPANADQPALLQDGRPASFADLAQKVAPAVVNISSTHRMDGSGADGMGPDGPGDLPFAFPPGSPFEEFLRPFLEQHRRGFGQDGQRPVRPRNATSLGSGFIIDPAGYIVTNNHVIEGASEITVTLNDDTELPAKLIGTDPKTDIALLKVETERKLPSVAWGDSDKARVGDWVMAVGNPFGLGGTVTAGIVSARGRDIQEGPFDDFIQIDAAINRGNSGGPTFDLAGNVVGINTAIYSPSGGSVGIGFAIPSNLARDVVAQLRENGTVERGWLGVEIQQVTPDLAQGLGLDEPRGALVANVDPASPAGQAGIEAGDVILGFDGSAVKELRDLPRLVAAAKPGDKAEILVLRGGREQTLNATIGRMENDAVVASAGPAPESSGGIVVSDVLGARLAPLDDTARQRFGLADDAAGVVVADLADNSPLLEQGIRPGDVIVKVGDRLVSKPAEIAEAALKVRDSAKPVLLMLVNRDGRDRFVAVNLKDA
ncbi:serine protease Do [Dongia mobilis]|uniref:Probable periplasmic serine endoprotease DegP-like n=1 Tax=Dongia mobilis TaxID=578943 RepID=A0A4R6WU06_9PROT|nr:DegQ family serine endoprotease [Dongia mobilis]TDQ82380.1 serine protease Do [Dongia mobilis]